MSKFLDKEDYYLIFRAFCVCLLVIFIIAMFSKSLDKQDEVEHEEQHESR